MKKVHNKKKKRKGLKSFSSKLVLFAVSLLVIEALLSFCCRGYFIATVVYRIH